MKIYQVYLYKLYFDRNAHSDDIEWSRNVRASKRTEALAKCLPDIESLELKMRPDVKQYGVNVGERYNPSAYPGRLVPIFRKRTHY